MVLTKILRAGEGKIVRRLSAVADHIDALEPDFVDLTDAELRAKTDEYRKRYADGESLDELLPEAFATVREAAKRTVGQRHYPVQLMGGAALHLGNVAEMKTGEGKTLAATLPSYLNALAGKGVHVVTVNDYLAKFHAEWMGRVQKFLGLSVGVILSQQDQNERRAAYAADITYGTNNEFGFDYLRDNMATDQSSLVQRGHFFAIVDEVDSILIDEARTPLIISGAAEHNTKWYIEFARLMPMMRLDEHYEVDEGKRTVGVTEKGVELVEDQLGIANLYDTTNTPLIGYLNNAIRAKELYKLDRDYIVADNGEVLIVDEFTGRILVGRRFNEGLHQAIEAKENVEIKQENQTLATITLQNYFRLYERLSGMTGTAQTEANELHQTYKLGVVPIPPNKPMVRIDQPDIIYKSEEAKFEAVVADIAERHANGQPILVGTASVAKSEYLSALLLREGIPHEVLNAKYHEKEAAIVAQAGRPGAVTVATNMAGRGTDIVLGGNPEFMADLELRARGLSPTETPDEYEAAWESTVAKVKAQVDKEGAEVIEAGGLYVLGTERHESRRIDNQLRGRSGRQGDKGESRFYLSLGDDLMQRFNANVVESIMARLRLPEDHPIESKMVSRAIRSAQTQVEQQNFETRKNVLKYDEVLNKQREVIYDERRKVLAGEDLHEQVAGMLNDVINDYVAGATAAGYPEDWDLEALWTALAKLYPVSISIDDVVASVGGDLAELTSEHLVAEIYADAQAAYQRREDELGAELLRLAEREILLAIIDQKWREHLYEMDYLKEGINLRSMAQRDPLVEYRREGYDLFTTMLDSVKEDSVTALFNTEIEAHAPPEIDEEELISTPALPEDTVEQEVATTTKPSPRPRRIPSPSKTAPAVGGLQYSGPSLDAPEAPREDPQSTTVVGSEPGRNEPCPCGSGLKYKKCHGAVNAK